MKTFAYDLECYKNLFTATFVNVDNPLEKYSFYIGLGKEDYSDIVQFLNEEITLVGYNNHSYDDPLLRYIQWYKSNDLNKDLFYISGKLVSDDWRGDKQLLQLRFPRKTSQKWKSIDLMKILGFDKLGISLKQTAINLKWHRIQDLPIHYDAKIANNQLDLILDYNENDVLITKRLYEVIEPIRKLREDLSALYNVDLSSASDSKMANLILENIYANELRIDIRQIKDLRTPRDFVKLGHCIGKFVSFETIAFQDLVDRIEATVVYYNRGYKYAETFYYGGLEFNLGIGGLHTNDKPGVFISDENYLIQDMDVSSYYPNLIINNNFYPEHLGPNFIKILKKITLDRVEAKHAGNKVKADGLKITVNSIFGKLGFESFWLLDAKQMLATTVTGQLGLLMLVEKLMTNGIDVISCNTDGIVCKIERSKLDKYYEIAKEWETKANLELEYTPYKKYIRRDVNNYVTEKEDGKTKEKGAFTKTVVLNKGYRMPIVAVSLFEFYINGTPIRETIEKSRDIMDFCISQKASSNFSFELHTMEGIQKLQKTNRFFISHRGGNLVKRDRGSSRLTGLYVGNNVTILNEYDESIPFEDYSVDISFYEKEALKIVEEINPPQLNLFDLGDVDRGMIRKMEMASSEIEMTEKKYSISELNSLGKNQLMRHVERVVSANEKIEGISPRYVYVTKFNSSSMTADLYCLAKGQCQSIKINKTAYKNNPVIGEGRIIFCNRFTKNDGGEFVLSDFKSSDKFDIVGVSIM